jgi:hypothetical protein
MERRGADPVEDGHGPRRARGHGQRLLATLVGLLVVAVIALSAAAVHYESAARRSHGMPRSAPAASTQATDQSMLTRHGYRLLNGTLRVHVLAIVLPDFSRDVLIMWGRVVGGVPKHRYVLAGGYCPGHNDWLSLQGVTDARGDAVLQSRARTVLRGATHYFSLKPYPCDSPLMHTNMP